VKEEVKEEEVAEGRAVGRREGGREARDPEILCCLSEWRTRAQAQK
jgi:hypothetical protein